MTSGSAGTAPMLLGYRALGSHDMEYLEPFPRSAGTQCVVSKMRARAVASLARHFESSCVLQAHIPDATQLVEEDGNGPADFFPDLHRRWNYQAAVTW